MPDDITELRAEIRLLSSRVQQVEFQVPVMKEDFTKMEARAESIANDITALRSQLTEFVRVTQTAMARNEVSNENIGKGLAGLEDTVKWLVRLIIGAVVLGGASFVIQGGLNIVP